VDGSADQESALIEDLRRSEKAGCNARPFSFYTKTKAGDFSNPFP